MITQGIPVLGTMRVQAAQCIEFGGGPVEDRNLACVGYPQHPWVGLVF